MSDASRPPWLRSNPPARLAYQTDPLRRSLHALGTKWTLLLLRDMAFLRLARFSDLLRNNPGLTPRVLSRRLKEMQIERLIVRSGAGRHVSYALTPRGQDAVYVLLAFLKYGLKYHDQAGLTLPSR
ncbi:MAG TPA: helix-turn-helix domain-containing protein [Thermoplasmata archaeon]|nr:helix-turn-helix domain-containing protein [Thermoplasmata archaeon]